MEVKALAITFVALEPGGKELVEKAGLTEALVSGVRAASVALQEKWAHGWGVQIRTAEQRK